jgi:hypothetical protein
MFGNKIEKVVWNYAVKFPECQVKRHYFLLWSEGNYIDKGCLTTTWHCIEKHGWVEKALRTKNQNYRNGN